jgi:hypothetical protein
VTHEGFIQKVRELVCQRISGKERTKLEHAKLVYGIGGGGYRGITYYEGWENGGKGDFLEVAALGEESPIQLAGTTIHELGHSLCGPGHGHGKVWKKACKVLGLNAKADSGQDYRPEDFDPDLWDEINKIIELKDGKPNWATAIPSGTKGLITFTKKIRPCPLGIGTRGGKSRGPGSGSRLRLWICSCGVRVRVSSDDFRATCNRCLDFFHIPAK